MGWKPASVKSEPVPVKGVGTSGTPRIDEEAEKEYEQALERENAAEERAVVRNGKKEPANEQDWRFIISNQLSEIIGRLSKIEQRLNKSVDQEIHETVKNNTPAKLPSGMVKPPTIVDVPGLDLLGAAMTKYIKKHGREMTETRLAQYKVKKAGELTDEQRVLFLQDIAV